MKNLSIHILRVGLAITFVWIGILILQDPMGWGGYIQPWAANLIPIPIKVVMIATAILDVTVGFFLLIDVFTWLFALFGVIHLTVVLITTGITAFTVRDIGLLAAAFSLFLQTQPGKFQLFQLIE